MTTTALLLNVLFSAIGLGFFVYGKRQQAMVPLVCGLLLMVFPFFVSNTLATAGIGAVLTVIPWFARG